MCSSIFWCALWCPRKYNDFRFILTPIYCLWILMFYLCYSCIQHDYHIRWYSFRLSVTWTVLVPGPPREFLGPRAKGNLPPPLILQIMILKLSPPRCVISKESAQQKWIDELWFRKQLSTCLFVWTLNYNDLVHLLKDVFL